MVERELGEILTISVGTALAFEVILKDQKPLKYDYVYLNTRTLFRNFQNAIVDPDKYSLTQLREAFLDELLQVKMAVTETLPGNILPMFYVCNNKSMQKMFTWAQLHAPKTEKQKAYQSLETKVMEWIMLQPIGKEIKIFDCLIKGSNSKALMLTHTPLDLLSHSEFRKLDLLESNTGMIKEPAQWNSKLTNDEAYVNMPFNILTIQVIGDKSKQFSSLGVKYIRPLVELAEKNRWSPATTIQKIKFDIEKLRDKLLAAQLMEMISVKLR